MPILKNVSLSLTSGELCALTGTSGSGKTTLLNILSLLDTPDQGSLSIAGCETTTINEDERSTLRGDYVGIVFQSFILLEHLTAIENVALPLIYKGVGKEGRLRLAYQSLLEVGLKERIHHFPNELSGGQKQRVAIARALVGRPKLVLADEPTGNLDSQSADEIMSLFLELNAKSNQTFLIVTHDPTIAARCHRRIVMRDGCIVDDDHESVSRVRIAS